MKYKAERGFTLIELMIVVVIIGILATFANSSYQNSVRKARRGDAKAALLELAQLMERNYTEANRFDQDPAGTAIALGTNLGFNTSPNTGGSTFYNLSFATLASQSFTLQAVPVSPQTKDTRCMTLTLSNTGARAASTGNNTECWGR